MWSCFEAGTSPCIPPHYAKPLQLLKARTNSVGHQKSVKAMQLDEVSEINLNSLGSRECGGVGEI